MDSLYAKKGWVLALLLFFSLSLSAAPGDLSAIRKTVAPADAEPGGVSHKRFFFLAEYKVLHSTHQDNFMGKDLVFSYRLNPNLLLGLGMEYTSSKFHDDNGWRIYNIRFIPIFADAKLFLPGSRLLAPFLQLSEGISFNHYNRMDPPYTSSYFVSESGDYLYTGIGCVIRINRFLKPVIGIGFNGFKMSFNSLDVNPHGFTFRIGLHL